MSRRSMGTLWWLVGMAFLTRPYHQDPAMTFHNFGNNAEIIWDPYLTVPASNNNPEMPPLNVFVEHRSLDQRRSLPKSSILPFTESLSMAMTFRPGSSTRKALARTVGWTHSRLLGGTGNAPNGNGTNAITLLSNAARIGRSKNRAASFLNSSTIPPPTATLTQNVTVNNTIIATSTSGSVTTLTFNTPQTFGTSTLPVTISGAPNGGQRHQRVVGDDGGRFDPRHDSSF